MHALLRSAPFVLFAILPAGAALAAQEANGLTGHLGASVNLGVPVSGFQHGISFYSSVATLDPNPRAGVQLGAGTWLIPDNRSFNDPLCPVGTMARDNWPERGPSYRDVYQTLEGGVGQWVTTRFPTPTPKFRINATPDCYNTQLSTPGFHFYVNPLPAGKLGIAQLSNRLMLPPDGLMPGSVTATSLLGFGWIALPLVPAYTSPAGAATGDQSWTLFLHAANFKGPVAFFTPETWSAVHAVDTTGLGRSHDARPAYTYSVALEIGQTPMFTATANGVRYRRVPRLTFPADGSGKAVLLQDVRYYSKAAIWDPVTAWLDNGTVATEFVASGTAAPTITGTQMGLTLGGAAVAFGAGFSAGAVTNSAGAPAFGLTWTAPLEPGVLPEYYREVGNTWEPIPASQVPGATGLASETFAPAVASPPPALSTAAGTPWASSGWSAGPFTARLGDGSRVDYVWYRFIDQPAITRLSLDAPTRQRLQAFAESLHQATGLTGVTFAAPSAGTLAALEAAQLVTPPPGLEKGYVPIAISQARNLGGVGASPASFEFGGQTINTTSAGRLLQLRNDSSVPVTIGSVTVSAPFAISSNGCGTSPLGPGQACLVVAVFRPTAEGAAARWLSVATSEGVTVVPLSGAERSLVTHYYQSILRRAPDAGGKTHWTGEATRVVNLGADVNEVWYAMAQQFYFSPEYAAFNRNASGFVTDLYTTFFNRAPDAGGLAHWVDQLGRGMPREVALAEFMFSAEFRGFTQAMFGTSTVRAEVNAVTDFYRGLLARTPDSGGFNHWWSRFRAAQCQGQAAVLAEVEAISSLFARSAEYAARNRNNSQFVGDLYNAFLRRGGDLGGVQFWIDQLNSGARTREQLRVEFKNSPEFQARVQAIIQQGCLP